MKTFALIVVAALNLAHGLAPAAAAAGAADGRVTGTIEVSGHRLPLTKVLVVALGNEEGLEGAPILRIVVSDVDVPLRTVIAASHAGLRAWARANDATVALITADASGQEQGGVYVLLHARGLGEVPIGSASGNQALAPYKVTSGRAMGKAAFESSTSVIEANFDGPIYKVPATVQDGRATADSAPVVALAAFRDALRKDDLKEAARHATAQRMAQLQAFKSQSPPGYQALTRAIPSGASVRAGVVRVVVRGESASVVQRTKEVTEMSNEGGDWKVD